MSLFGFWRKKDFTKRIDRTIGVFHKAIASLEDTRNGMVAKRNDNEAAIEGLLSENDVLLKQISSVEHKIKSILQLL